MEGSVAPNVGEVTSTGSQGYQPEMNLRSVFTVEQQRILQRYYENGMINQSKSCFQLILQCAQETKLDFSVVRTWVGNKRRKMSSKNYTELGSSLQGSVSSSPSRPPEVTVRNVPNITHSQAPRTSSSTSDLIMTGVYNTNNSSGRQGSTQPTIAAKSDILKPSLQRSSTRNETEYVKLHSHAQRQAVPLSKTCLQQLDHKNLMLSRQPSVANPPNLLYAKKNFGGSTGPMQERTVPQKIITWSLRTVDAPGGQSLHKTVKPTAGPISHVSMVQQNRDTSCGLKDLEIREVFSLATADHSSRLLGSCLDERPRGVESNCFSIAMETGDVDEYAREEELASMGAQNQACSRFRETNGSPHAENKGRISPVPTRTGNCKAIPTNTRDLPEKVFYQSRDFYVPPNTSTQHTTSTPYTSDNTTRNSLNPHYTALSQPRLSQNQNNYQVSGNLSVPWITECSRKRTLQDRTQFSDRDLAMLKKYWDNGMTSLGSVCREKIEAVAVELNVDCEIVRTWIGNRRRKYRLMGIEVPPPRGGPANFPDQLDSGSLSLPSGDDPVAEVESDHDRNDEISTCLSEESTQADEMLEAGRNEDIVIKEDSPGAIPVHNMKVEVLEEGTNDAMDKYDVEQMRLLLDFKSEEMRCMESELENYKHKLADLQVFTRNLIHAVKTNDKDQQQILLTEASLDFEVMDYNYSSPDPDDTSYSMSSPSDKHTPDSV
ncbi:highly divergent homeobox [Pelodytes ibericus]